MSDRHAALDEYRVAPDWMLKYVADMQHVIQHNDFVAVVVAPDAWFASLQRAGEQVEAACMSLQNGGTVIILPYSAEDSEHWRDVLAHEFAHAVHDPIDRLTAGKVAPAAYERAVEDHIKLLGGLIQFAVNVVLPAKGESEVAQDYLGMERTGG